MVDAWQLGHAYSVISTSRVSTPSTLSNSSRAARYSRMASWMFAKASSSVSPSDQQPGKPGTETLIPSSERWSATLYLIDTSANLAANRVASASHLRILAVGEQRIQTPHCQPRPPPPSLGLSYPTP